MSALILAQTIFYLVASLAIVIFGVLLGMVAYYFVQIARQMQNLSENLNQASDEIKENIGEIFDNLSRIPFLSFLFKENKDEQRKLKKGRKI